MLIHGIGSSWRIWKPVIPALQARHEVLAISLPGYGESPPLEQEPTAPALTDAVERELDEAGWDKAHVVGSSLGGWITAELAARGRALSAIAIDPAGLWTRKELRYSRRSLRQSLATSRRIAPFARRLTGNAVMRTLLFSQVQARGWRNDPEEAAYAVRALAHSPSFLDTLSWIERNHAMPRGLGEIDCPFLVVWGSWDVLLPARMAHRWQRLIAGAELRLLPRLGHVPFCDDPDTVAGLIADFTARRRAHAEVPG